ncbi:MAG: response regulator, partial [Sandaracinaceae bacterium]
GNDAWAVLSGASPPAVAVLDWHMGSPDGLELCRRLSGAGASTYVILVTADPDTSRVIEALGAVAHDFIRKPVGRNELVARVRAGMRVGGDRRSVLQVLNEGLALGAGELVVKSSQAVGRVFVHDGRIAWVHLAASDSEPLGAQVGLAPDVMREVVRESRVSGRSFADVLVEWRLVTEEVLREKLRVWFGKKLARLLALEASSCVFLPESRPFAGKIAFTLEELLPSLEISDETAAEDAWLTRHLFTPAFGIPRPQLPPEEPRPPGADRLGELLEIESSVCAWMGTLGSGSTTVVPPLSVPGALDAHMTWAVAQGGDFRDALITTETGFTLLCSTRSRRHLIGLELAGSDANPAYARLLLRSFVASIEDT